MRVKAEILETQVLWNSDKMCIPRTCSIFSVLPVYSDICVTLQFTSPLNCSLIFYYLHTARFSTKCQQYSIAHIMILISSFDSRRKFTKAPIVVLYTQCNEASYYLVTLGVFSPAIDLGSHGMI